MLFVPTAIGKIPQFMIATTYEQQTVVTSFPSARSKPSLGTWPSLAPLDVGQQNGEKRRYVSTPISNTEHH